MAATATRRCWFVDSIRFGYYKGLVLRVVGGHISPAIFHCFMTTINWSCIRMNYIRILRISLKFHPILKTLREVGHTNLTMGKACRKLAGNSSFSSLTRSIEESTSRKIRLCFRDAEVRDCIKSGSRQEYVSNVVFRKKPCSFYWQNPLMTRFRVIHHNAEETDLTKPKPKWEKPRQSLVSSHCCESSLLVRF